MLLVFNAHGTGVSRSWKGIGAGGSGTDFNNVANWTGGGGSISDDLLTMGFTNDAAVHTITMSAAVNIQSLTTTVGGILAGTFNLVIGFNLSIAGAFNVVNASTLAVANLAIQMNFTVNPGITLSCASYTGNVSGATIGDLQINATMNGNFICPGAFQLLNSSIGINSYSKYSSTGITTIGGTTTMYGSGGGIFLTLLAGSVTTFNGDFTCAATLAGQLQVAQNAAVNFNGTNITNGGVFLGDGNLTFDGVGAQTFTNNGSLVYVGGNLTIGNINTPTVTFAGASPSINGADNPNTVIIKTGATLDLGILSLTRSPANGLGSLLINGTLKLGAANFPSGYSVYTLAAGTVNYYQAGNQTMSAQNYGNLILSSSGAKRVLSSTGIAGDFTITGSATANATVTATTVTYNGIGAQVMGGITYSSLVANSIGPLNLATGATVNAVATFTKGIINNRISGAAAPLNFIASASAASASAISYVSGYVSKTGVTAFTFPVGDVGTIAGTAFHTLSISAPSLSTTVTTSYVSSLATPNSGNLNLINGIDPVAYWTFANAGSTTATSTITIATRDVTGLFLPGSQLFVAGYNIATNYWEQLGAPIALLAGGQSLSTTAPIILNNYSAFTVGSTSAILPITLLGFTGMASGCTANLTWQTSTEVNSAYYGVEASLDGSHFNQVAKVASKNNAIGAAYTYSYALRNGTNYFRLKAVDNDDKFTYSAVVAVMGTGACGTSLSVHVSPNPSKDVVNIQGLVTGSTVTVYSINGQKLTSVIATSTNQSINISRFAKGVYVLRILMVDGSVSNLKVVKN